MCTRNELFSYKTGKKKKSGISFRFKFSDIEIFIVYLCEARM